MNRPDLSVVIVTYRSRDVIDACLIALDRALADAPRLRAEVLLLDACSDDGVVEHVRSAFPRVDAAPLPRNGGFAYGVNRGIERSRGRHVLLLNPDTLLGHDVLHELVAHLDRHPLAAAVAPALVDSSGEPAISTQRFPSLRQEMIRQWEPLVGPLGWKEETANTTGAVDWVSGACLLLRRDAIEQVGTLDEGYFLYWEETDWCRRARNQGWQIHHLPKVEVVHIGGASASASGETVAQGRVARAYVDSRRRYFRKHHGAHVEVAVEGVHLVRRIVRRAKAWRAS